MKSLTRDHDAGFGQLFVILSYLREKLLIRHTPGFGILVRFNQNHELHFFSFFILVFRYRKYDRDGEATEARQRNERSGRVEILPALARCLPVGRHGFSSPRLDLIINWDFNQKSDQPRNDDEKACYHAEIKSRRLLLRITPG